MFAGKFSNRSWMHSFSWIILIVALVSFSACEEETEPEPPPTIFGSADVNGSYTTFTRATFTSTPENGRVKNVVSLARSDNSTVVIQFFGTELGTYDLPNPDTLIRCRYIDASDRIFKSDSGKIVISDYYVTNSIITVSGGFEFEGDFINPNTGLVSNIRITNGGFVNVKTEP